jgi:hypothetical protein
MMRRTDFIPFLALMMALIGVAVNSPQEANAASMGAKGVTITGSGAPVTGTDPLFTYTFDAVVNPGYTFGLGDYIEFVKVPGEDGNNTILTNVSPASGFGYPTILPTGSPTGGATPPYSPSNTFTSDLTWTYSGSAIGSPTETETLPIAVFTIQTNVALTSLPELVVFNAETQNPQGQNYFQTGTISLVPEPSSVVLLFTGLAAVSVPLIRGRSRCGRYGK